MRRSWCEIAVLTALLLGCRPAPARVIEPRSGMELMLVRAGTFTMGSPATETGHRADEVAHRVTISRDFYLGRDEVTQRQWQKVMGT
ncbi:MAG: hypothetical protein QOH21_2228, partial [Acidobacteriota bacterium]|nr:hypothetical protein [Acidobacteriota bacterium]